MPPVFANFPSPACPQPGVSLGFRAGFAGGLRADFCGKIQRLFEAFDGLSFETKTIINNSY